MNQKRYAFLIGANGPQTQNLSSLKYAERDAERLATALRESPCTFTKAEWITAANREETLTKLKTFSDQCEPSDLLLIHFSGHGLYDEQLYLICDGTDITNLDASAIGVDAVKRILRKCKALHKLLVLDCCYAGGAFSGAFKGGQNIEGMLSKEFEGSASIILSACSRLERARELASLDGGAGFLSWVLLASCTARLSEVSPDHRSLSLMDIWRWMPTALAEVNTLLGAAEQLPRPLLISQLESGTDGEIWLTKVRRDSIGRSNYEREHFLRALLADHSSFMHDRLSSFVGREKELAKIRQRIAEQQQVGGYVTITGHAGQGKSSLIARLVDFYQQEGGAEGIAFHFIPFNPGPEHQVGLLRNLMARLILKYNLSDLYVASESRPALRDYFPKVLGELAVQGGQEVIFIDGLDQLEAEDGGGRDLSFLPNNPPPGVVFVLGTRPNDTLRPLELLKPRYEYQLPDLSREDFDLILRHRQVPLGRGVADRFYAAMQGNALYLDLLAKELVAQGTADPEVLIKQIADNPEHVFSLAVARLKRQPGDWREIIKPMLGVLLAEKEPLGRRHIRQILGVDDDRLREGMERLGGLIVRDWQQRYSLFHLKLYEYLRQDEQRPSKEYIFATDEEEGWHKRVADWCEQGNLTIIWQDVKHDAIEQQRREYARQHYVAHLYRAHEWQRLFQALDSVEYGKAKIGDDPSMRSYAQDLDFGRQAASWEGWTLKEAMALLPRLWRYTFFRCSLTSRADRYPLAAFQLLVLLKRKQEALGLAELLTNPVNKVQALLHIIRPLLEQSDQEKEGLALLLRADEIARTIEDSNLRTEALANLGIAQVQARQWEQTQTIIGTIQGSSKLWDLATALVQAQQWEQAQTVIDMIEEAHWRAAALVALATALAQAQQWEQAQAVINTIEDTSRQAEALVALATALAQAQQWERAQEVVDKIEEIDQSARALCEIGVAFIQAQQVERAQAVLNEAESLAHMIKDDWARMEVSCRLGGAWAQAEQLKRAQVLWNEAVRLVCSEHSDWLISMGLLVIGSEIAQAQQWKLAEAIWIEAALAAHRKSDPADTAEALHRLTKVIVRAQRWSLAKEIARTIEQSYERNQILSEIGVALIQVQQREHSQAVMGEVEASVHVTKDDWLKTEMLCKLGTALAQTQQREHAQKIWAEVEASTRMMESDWQKDKALQEVARAATQTQQWDHAEALIHMIKDSSWRAEALASLVASLAQAQQWEQAQAAWNQAQAVINTIEDSSRQAETLVALATALAQVQQWEQAQAAWNQAQAVINTIEDSSRQAEALVALVASLAQAQQWEHAQAVIDTLKDRFRQERALQILVTEKAGIGENEALLHVIHRSWRLANKREEVLGLFPMITALIPHNPDLGSALYDAFVWVDSFLKG